MRSSFHVLVLAAALEVSAVAATLTVDVTGEGRPISPMLMGVFYEDLSYAADGGLYAELIENRSFDYSPSERKEWHPLSFWHLERRGGGEGELISETADPLHPNNPSYLVIGVRQPGEGVGVVNHGWGGIPVRQGETYDFSVFARQLSNPATSLTVQLETRDGSEVLAKASLPGLSGSWTKFAEELRPIRSVDDARLVLLAHGPGRIGLDMVSLFPRKTFKGRPNGLRADLAEIIAELKPRFVRFPGGCLVHGDGVDNFYNWKHSIGPVEVRKGQRNIWRYHQSLGLGYFEYFQFCEDIGAEPLPVVPAGVSCQNSGASVTGRYGEGQQGVPMADMPVFISDILDLIEWANGPADSEWGSKRAAAGHPEPFHLKYLGVGNEDKITPAFAERFKMIHEAIKKAHPGITVIGTTGPWPDGEDYEKGWELARKLGVEMVDEHCYKEPGWFWDHLERWDSYDRMGPKVYLGEWAAHDVGKRSTLRAALAEAAYWTSMERNGDVVAMASYAPLLARTDNTHWTPNLVYFDNTSVYPTISYEVQKVLGSSTGDRWLETRVVGADGRLAASTVRDRATGEVFIKLVNGEDRARQLEVRVQGAAEFEKEAVVVMIGGKEAGTVNAPGGEPIVRPERRRIAIGESFSYEAPRNSLSVFRLEAR